MRLRLSLALLTLSTVVLVGCHKQFTRERFELLRVGVDDRADVRATLGPPTRSFDDQWFYDNLKRHRSVLIHFDADGKVSGKEWMDARTGEWEGRNPNTDEPPAGEIRAHRRDTTRIDED